MSSLRLVLQSLAFTSPSMGTLMPKNARSKMCPYDASGALTVPVSEALLIYAQVFPDP